MRGRSTDSRAAWRMSRNLALPAVARGDSDSRGRAARPARALLRRAFAARHMRSTGLNGAVVLCPRIGRHGHAFISPRNAGVFEILRDDDTTCAEARFGGRLVGTGSCVSLSPYPLTAPAGSAANPVAGPAKCGRRRSSWEALEGTRRTMVLVGAEPGAAVGQASSARAERKNPTGPA